MFQVSLTKYPAGFTEPKPEDMCRTSSPIALLPFARYLMLLAKTFTFPQFWKMKMTACVPTVTFQNVLCSTVEFAPIDSTWLFPVALSS